MVGQGRGEGVCERWHVKCLCGGGGGGGGLLAAI